MRTLEEIKKRYGTNDPLALHKTLEDIGGSESTYKLGLEAIIDTIPELVQMIEKRDARIEELEMQARLRGGG